jgi:hypothetical protein
MEVHLLDITIYEDDGWTWRTEEIREPTWADIEVAIRRLDRFHYPSLSFRHAVSKHGSQTGYCARV